MLKNILLVGTGGFIGSVGRYFISRLNLSLDYYSIPVGTLTVNVAGSLIIGFLAGIAGKTDLLSLELRLFLMVGFVGGFTTFSTFTNENMVLMQNGQFLSALIYTFISLFLGFLAVYLGYSFSNLI